MRVAPKLREVRRLVVQTFHQLGAAAPNLFDMEETVLIDDGKHAARTYRVDGLMAMWLVEIGLLQFYDAEGQPTVNMQAPVLRNDPELQLGTVEHPTIRLNKPGAVWNLTSDAAIVTADKEHVRLAGAVQLQKYEFSSGARIELDTREVTVEVTPQTASTDQPVDIFDGYNRLNAIGLDLDMKSDTFKLRQQVKATYAVN